MDTMSIAALSVNMNQQRVQQDVGISVLDKVFDDMNSSTDLVKELSVGTDVNLGNNVDINV